MGGGKPAAGMKKQLKERYTARAQDRALIKAQYCISSGKEICAQSWAHPVFPPLTLFPPTSPIFPLLLAAWSRSKSRCEIR